MLFFVSSEDTSRIIFKSVGAGLKDSRFVQSDSRDREVIAFQTFSPRTISSSAESRERLPPTGREVQTLTHPARNDKLKHNRLAAGYQNPKNIHSQPSYHSSAHHQQQQQHPSPTSGSGYDIEDVAERADVCVGGKKVTFQTDLTTQNLKTFDLCQKMNLHRDVGYHGSASYHGNHGTQRPASGSRPRSQDDDDNTTTSGSYTLNPENDFDDISPVPFPVS